jgi:hypothetical protein
MPGVDGKDAAHADGPCFNNETRYADCGNGTVTDTATGLIWLKDAACFGTGGGWDWVGANHAVAGLKHGDCGGNLTDNSSPGDWRLPTKDEWIATTFRAITWGCTGGNAPSLTNDVGTACFSVGPSSFVGVEVAEYWSSTTDESFPTFAWAVRLSVGSPNVFGKMVSPGRNTWPVRGARR